MRSIHIVVGILALAIMAGCGGGGSGTNAQTVSLTVPAGVTSPQGAPAVEYKTSEQLLGIPGGHEFLGGVDATPHDATFTGGSGTVTLTFSFAAPLAPGVQVGLFEKDSQNNWTMVPNVPVQLSADRSSGKVQLDSFCATGNYAILSIVI